MGQRHHRHALSAGASVLAIALAAGAAHAAPAATPGEGTSVAELVVTAERREEALQDVPIAVSAFTQQRLEAQRLDTGGQLILSVPNVTFAQNYYSGFNFQIRGVGTQLGALGDSGVGVHLNDMPLTASRFFEAELFDVQQVEVLRGPQGTLYGRNATGGVVNVKTAGAKDDFAAQASVEAGTYGTFKAKGFINVPLGDSLALRVAGSYLKRSGFGHNTLTGASVDDRDLYSTRATLRFHPTEAFEANLTWQHFEENDNRVQTGGMLCTKDPGPASVGGVALSNPITRGFLSQGCANASLYSDAAHGTPNSIGTLFGTLPLLFGVQSGDYNAGKLLSTNLHDVNSFFEPEYKAKTDVYQLQASYKLTDHLELESLSGFTKDGLNNLADFTNTAPSVPFNPTALTPQGIFNDPQLGPLNAAASRYRTTQPSRQWTQEFRLQSTFPGPFNFSAGMNYLNYKSDLNVTVFSNIFTLASVALNGGIPCAVNNPGCIYIDPNVVPNGSGHNYYVNRNPYKLISSAIFGEIYYNITDDLKLTAGGRYTHDNKRQINIGVGLLTPGAGSVIGTPPTFVVDSKEPTGRLGLDWKLHPSFTDQTLLYAFYSRGYKAGGSNSQAGVTSTIVKRQFAPEFIDSYEVGLKNTLLGGALTANLTGFYYNYTDYQVSEIVDRHQVVENVNAKIYGAEFEAAWRPTPQLQLDANVGLLHTSIGNSQAIDPANITAGNPALTLVKNSGGANCAVSTAALAPLLAIIEQRPGAPTVSGVSGNPTALLGVCSGAFASAFGLTPIDGQVSKLSGNELPNSPHWTVSLGAQYSWTLPGGWDATLRGDYYVQDAAYSRIFNLAEDRLKGWHNINATLTVKNPNGWQGQLFVKNLTNEQPIVNTFLFDAITGLYSQGFTNEPRIVGAGVSKQF